MIMDRDEKGYPVLMAVPEPVPEPEQVAKPIPPSVKPATVDHDEWDRRRDAVRSAAREFEDLKDQDLRELVQTHRPLTDDELAQLKVDVRHKVLDDLIDGLDQRTRGKLRGRRTVRLVMPAGYTRKAMRSLSPEEADQVEARLRARGWNDKQIKDDLRGKLPHLQQST